MKVTIEAETYPGRGGWRLPYLYCPVSVGGWKSKPSGNENDGLLRKEFGGKNNTVASLLYHLPTADSPHSLAAQAHESVTNLRCIWHIVCERAVLIYYGKR